MFILIAVLGGIYFFVFGESGLIERIELKKKQAELSQRIELLRAENAELQRQCESSGKGENLPDEALNAGYITPGQKLVFFRGTDEGPPSGEKAEEGVAALSEPSHLRILWLVLSIMSVIAYYMIKHRHKEQHQ